MTLYWQKIRNGVPPSKLVWYRLYVKCNHVEYGQYQTSTSGKIEDRVAYLRQFKKLLWKSNWNLSHHAGRKNDERKTD